LINLPVIFIFYSIPTWSCSNVSYFSSAHCTVYGIFTFRLSFAPLEKPWFFNNSSFVLVYTCLIVFYYLLISFFISAFLSCQSALNFFLLNKRQNLLPFVRLCSHVFVPLCVSCVVLLAFYWYSLYFPSISILFFFTLSTVLCISPRIISFPSFGYFYLFLISASIRARTCITRYDR
jgi:hypothetical protein